VVGPAQILPGVVQEARENDLLGQSVLLGESRALKEVRGGSKRCTKKSTSVGLSGMGASRGTFRPVSSIQGFWLVRSWIMSFAGAAAIAAFVDQFVELGNGRYFLPCALSTAH